MRETFIILACICHLTTYGQVYSKISIYQYEGNDSSDQTLVSEETYDMNGQLILKYLRGFRETLSIGSSDHSSTYVYRDSLKISSATAYDNNDSTKSFYYYNNTGQLIRQEHFDFKKRLKHDSSFKYRGCVRTLDDYEKEGSWEKTSEIHYGYDGFGNKILFEALDIHWDRQNRFTWAYDDQNRITEYNSYSDNSLIWTENYTYRVGGYAFTRTWYDYEGKPKHLKKWDHEYWPQYTFDYTFNKHEKLIREEVRSEKGELFSTKTFSYNDQGKLSSCTYFDKDGIPEITHIYHYEY